MTGVTPDPDPRADRRLRADARRNRGRILEAAHQTFMQDGLAAPVDLIAERAHVGVGTFYRHFPTKEALCTALVESRIDLLVAEAGRLEQSLEPGDAFFAFLRALVARSSEDMALSDAFADAGYDVKSGTVECKQRLLDAIDRLLRAAQAAGAVRDDLNGADVLAVVAGSCIAGRLGLADAHADRVQRVVFDGLRR